ncbi:MAG: hypothetical protein J3K34DRAFT_525879 [Monoraphidium minutum]|nr:MAG: hypothetical protein J3K34DRAFT_525879 [Monoraphidium minutum]
MQPGGARGAAAAAAGAAPVRGLGVPREQGVITAASAAPSGVFLAVGTCRGSVVVWDVRDDRPKAPCFLVQADGKAPKGGLGLFQAPTPRGPAVTGFAWSADSYQLVAYDAGSNARMWWMRPEPGQDAAECERQGRPMLPALAALITPSMVAASGKAPIEDESEVLAAEALAVEAAAGGAGGLVRGGGGGGAGAAAHQQRLMAQHRQRQWRPALHPAFTLTGTQPLIVLPRVTGDVLRVTTRIGAPVLPGFGPSPAAQAAAAAEAARRGDGAAARAQWQLPQAAVDFLMPPLAPNPELVSQAVYRRHDAHVVLVAFLSDGGTMLTVDQRGLVALWPAGDGDRSGFGWFKPKKCFQLPRSMRTCHASGGGGGGGGGGSGGGDLLAARVPWLVRYRAEPAAAPGGGWSVLRELLHRPPDGGGAGGAPAAARSLVVSAYEAAGGRLVARSKQRCVAARQPFKVVAAELTPSQRDLLLFCHVAGRGDDPDSFPTLSVMVLNLATMRCLVPCIDAPDPSYGTAAPAYALTPVLAGLGTEHLILGLGAGMLGAFSLATGQVAAELYPGIPPREWGDIEVAGSGEAGQPGEGAAPGGGGGGGGGGGAVVPGFALGHYASIALAAGGGGGGGGGGGAGRVLLAAAPAGGRGVFVFELELAAARAAAATRAAAAAEAAAAEAVAAEAAVARTAAAGGITACL